MSLHPQLKEAIAKIQITAPRLEEAASSNSSRVKEARFFLGKKLDARDVDLDVLALGSIARGEASEISDFDYLIMVHGLLSDVTVTRDVISSVEELMEQWDINPPGSSGLFGGVVAAPDLTERIGLEQDTNITLSRRVLILQESVSVLSPQKREELVRAIVGRYLADYDEAKKGVPRFMLNDFIRYWRTLAVDYQAKRWQQREKEWALRYLKLIISRKLTFAGTLVSILQCPADLSTGEAVDYFVTQFDMPPLARLAQLHERLDNKGLGRLGSALKIGDDFINALADREFREEAETVKSKSELRKSSLLSPLLGEARQLQDDLEVIFFDSRTLGELSRRYLSF